MSFSDRLRMLLDTVREQAARRKRGTSSPREYYQYSAERLDAPPPPPPVTAPPETNAGMQGPLAVSEQPLTSRRRAKRALRLPLHDRDALRAALAWKEILDPPVALRPRRGRRVR